MSATNPFAPEINESSSNEDIAEAAAKYCPFCKKYIVPCNIDDYLDGIDSGLIYVHDNVIHDDDYDFTEMH